MHCATRCSDSCAVHSIRAIIAAAAAIKTKREMTSPMTSTSSNDNDTHAATDAGRSVDVVIYFAFETGKHLESANLRRGFSGFVLERIP